MMGLEPHSVAGDVELGSILDSHHPLFEWDEAGKQVEEGRLSRSGSAGHEHRLSAHHCFGQGPDLLLRRRAH